MFADVTRHIKHDGSVVTVADVSMQKRLKSDLARHWPEYDFLGEEMTGDEHELLTAGGQGQRGGPGDVEGQADQGRGRAGPKAASG